MRPRSPEDERYTRHSRRRDDSRSESYRKRRSRSPTEHKSHGRRRDSLNGSSPDQHRRDYRDDRRRSGKYHSPSPRIKREEDDDRRHSSHHKSRRRSLSPRSRSRSPPKPSHPSKPANAPLPSQQSAYRGDPTSANSKADASKEKEIEKQKPNYAPTGKLAAETNTVANTSIVLKYNEPPESRLPPPSSPWRLYIFKDSTIIETLPLHSRTCWLFGRERVVVDHATEHPSCSKQHAVLQFRYTEKRDEWGEKKGGVKPYVIDLESANGTKVNGERIPERRYVEVRSGDVVSFGESTREYVVLLPPKEEKKSVKEEP